MNRDLTVAMTAALMMTGTVSQAQEVNIGRSNITLKSDLMTPEALWAMGRIRSEERRVGKEWRSRGWWDE